MRHPVDYAPSQDYGSNPTKHLPSTHWIIQQFGNYQPDGHTGIDYPCPVGTQVKAAAAGRVLHVGWMGGSYASNPWWIQPSFAGYVYVVDHGHFIGIYGHCKDASNWVNVGDQVAEGQTLGLSGNTGASTGPHLHFECLPAGFNLYGPMYGRINPHSLFSTISTQSVTPEDDFMATLNEDEKAHLFKVINSLAENAATKKDLTNTVDPRTFAPNEKQWVMAALTSIVENVATKRDIETVSGDVARVAAQSAATGASEEQIKEAVRQALAESIVNVAVSVGGK